jgi:hypothetical protein
MIISITGARERQEVREAWERREVGGRRRRAPRGRMIPVKEIVRNIESTTSELKTNCSYQ